MKSGIGCSLPLKNGSFSARNGMKPWRGPILTTAGFSAWTAKILLWSALRKAHRTDHHPQHEVRGTRSLEDQLVAAQKSGDASPVKDAALEARSKRQGPMLAIHQQVAACGADRQFDAAQFFDLDVGDLA